MAATMLPFLRTRFPVFICLGTGELGLSPRTCSSTSGVLCLLRFPCLDPGKQLKRLFGCWSASMICNPLRDSRATHAHLLSQHCLRPRRLYCGYQPQSQTFPKRYAFMVHTRIKQYLTGQVKPTVQFFFGGGGIWTWLLPPVRCQRRAMRLQWRLNGAAAPALWGIFASGRRLITITSRHRNPV